MQPRQRHLLAYALEPGRDGAADCRVAGAEEASTPSRVRPERHPHAHGGGVADATIMRAQRPADNIAQEAPIELP